MAVLTKAATDIKVFNGSAWISVKTNKVMLHNGTSFVNANNPKILHNGGDSNWYFIPQQVSFTLNDLSDVVLAQSTSTKTRVYSVTPAESVVSVYSKSWFLNVTIDSINKTITIGSNSFLEERNGAVTLSCSNGEPNITLFVQQGFSLIDRGGQLPIEP